MTTTRGIFKREGMELMKEESPLGRLASMIVWVAPKPEEVVFHIMEGKGKTVVEIFIPPEDRGRVIGTRGATISSIRTLFFASLTSEDPTFDVSLLEDGDSRRRDSRPSKDQKKVDG